MYSFHISFILFFGHFYGTYGCYYCNVEDMVKCILQGGSVVHTDSIDR